MIVTTCYTGTQRAVLVSSDEAIRDVLIHKQDHFSDRPPSVRAELMVQGCDVAFGNDSPAWHYKKNHMKRSMRQYGDGLKKLESLTLTYGLEMIADMEGQSGHAFDPYKMIRLCVGSIIMVLTYGYSTRADVNAFTKLEAEGIRMLQPKGLYLMLDIFPWLRFVFPKLNDIYKEVWKNGKDTEQLFRRFTDKRKENKELHVSNVFIDHFLNLLEAKSNSEPSEDKNNLLGEKDVIFMGIDLLMSGVTTTSATLYSLLGILVNHPSIQDKAHAEIMEVIGDRHPCIEDRQNMPFVEAVLLEAHRYISHLPVLIPHYCTSGTELNGYLIPEGTMILANIWSLQHNEIYWDQPWVFNPNRFLENGKPVPPDHINRQRVLNFGVGRRRCVGEIFAKNRLFILVTLLLQKFKFLPAEGHPRPEHDPRKYDVRLSILIKPYKLSAQLRK